MEDFEDSEIDRLYSYARLGQFIAKKRKERGLSQTELADKSGLDRAFVSNIERGQRRPSFGTVYKIATALNMRLSTLLKHLEKLDENSNGSGNGNGNDEA